MTEEQKKIKFPTEKHLQDIAGDKFGCEKLSKDIVDNILLQMELPNNFGIYGNWGSGKSTLLHFMMNYLKENKKDEIQVVYFEAWKYEYAENNDLILALLNQIKFDLGLTESKKLKNIISTIIGFSSWGLRSVGGVLGAQIDGMKGLQEEIEAVDKMSGNYEEWFDRIQTLEQDFKEVIEEGLKNIGKKELFIFIDDLDRCLPENAVKLLEAIKNFLNVENTLFVMAIDRRVISQMISKKYGILDNYGDEYLMKIIHYYYELPSSNSGDFVKEELQKFGIDNKIPLFGNFYADISNFIGKFVKEKRKIKHYLNLFGVYRSFIVDELDARKLFYLFITVYLKTKFGEKIFLKSVAGTPLSLAYHMYDDSSESTYSKIFEGFTSEEKKELHQISRFTSTFGGELEVSIIQNFFEKIK